MIVAIMNQTAIYLIIDQLLKDAANSKLRKKLDKLREVLTETLDEEYHEEVFRLLDDQSYDIRTTLQLGPVRKSRTKKELEPEIRCMARIGLGTQCSRSRTDDMDYCKSHMLSLPYGRIDMPEELEKKITKRRGRRCKAEKECSIEDLDMGKYVQAILITIDGGPYLLDQNNVLYHFNTNNEIAGTIVGDQIEWY